MAKIIETEDFYFLSFNGEVRLRMLIESFLSELRWLTKQTSRIDESLTISFPELDLNQCQVLAQKASSQLEMELQDCMVVIREAFYAFEPIIQTKQIIY